MKQILRGYASLFREILGRPNDGAFLTPPANPLLWVLICGAIGLIRNALHIALGAPGFYGFQADILWTMFVFPLQLALFPAALLHWQLRLLTTRNVPADSVFGLAFFLQIFHLMVPFVDWMGFRLGLPPAYVVGVSPIANAWYTNMLFLTPGITLAWLITAYTIARVLRLRFRVSWLGVIAPSLGTFVAILIPTYVLFPSFNTVFNSVFGPYLWSPLKYIFEDPRWFPFWGYGMYFMLTAIAGLVYRTKHSQRKDVQTLFEANSAGRAHAWLLGLALVRNILDYVWMPYYRSLLVWSLALFNTTVYIYMLYLVIPAIAGAVHARLFSRRVDAVPLLRDSLTVWLVYPMVSLISMIAKSPPRQTIDWFRYIPTFMVEDNFLPAGMLAVVPILAAAYTVLLMRHSRSNWLKSLVSVSLALLAVYLVYYQYTFRFFWEFFRTYGRFVAIGYYTLCFLAPMFLIAGRFERAFGKHSVGFTTLLLLSTLISCGLIVLGLLPS